MNGTPPLQDSPFAEDPIRDKFIHAVNWDYSSGNPAIERLRRQLAAEYDSGGVYGGGVMLPADPTRFMQTMRRAVRLMLDGMADKHLCAHPDELYKALFPFPDVPSIGDMLVLEAMRGAFGKGAR
ncbi:hypothetical protein [Bifidobacterium myosotis]|uniref:Uncharacterized protein n=1 Tax=Bifidobacterium myosotis TaxID=1630166 RepID=A0A5M9ZMV6_9BIFI|nr:hypothetical protein [Bifidobacterium myosotis]KAA8828182.1 hypothetical protein EMO91_07005 [Bifidobacterium myosotis]